MSTGLAAEDLSEIAELMLLERIVIEDLRRGLQQAHEQLRQGDRVAASLAMDGIHEAIERVYSVDSNRDKMLRLVSDGDIGEPDPDLLAVAATAPPGWRALALDHTEAMRATIEEIDVLTPDLASLIEGTARTAGRTAETPRVGRNVVPHSLRSFVGHNPAPKLGRGARPRWPGRS